MKLSTIVSISLLLTPAIAQADINFADYCPDPSVDCSSAMQAAASYASTFDHVINMPAETYIINNFEPVSPYGLTWNSFKLQGAGKNKTIIKTRNFSAVRIRTISIDGVGFEGIDTAAQGSHLVAFSEATSLSFTNNKVSNAARTLVSISESSNYTISGNNLSNSGVVRERWPTTGVPNGNGLWVQSSQNGDIRNNAVDNIWQVAVFLGRSGSGITSGITIDGNVINTVEDNGIRITGGHTSDNPGYGIYDITVSNNQLYNVNIDSIRANGDNVNITGNYINSSIGTNGIKSHSLKNSTISNNTVEYTAAGITLHSWGSSADINNVTIHNNEVRNNTNGITATYTGGAGFSNVHVTSNRVYDFAYNGISFYGNPGNFGDGSIHSNTLSNKNSGDKFNSSAIRAHNLTNLYFGNNYINGNGALAYIDNVKGGVVETSYIINQAAQANCKGGVLFTETTNNVTFRNNRFLNIYPGLTDRGTNNTNDLGDIDPCL